jgi:hypothetical protein
VRDDERSSRVKIADRGFPSRQSASFVPVECGKLGCFLLDNSGELLLASNQAPTAIAHAIEIDLSFGDLSRALHRFGVCVRACDLARHFLRQRRERGIRQNGNFHASAERAFPGAVFGPVLDFALVAIGALLALGSQGRPSARFAGFDVTKLRALDFIDRSAHCGAKCFAVTTNLALGDNAAGLRAREHAINAFECVDPAR